MLQWLAKLKRLKRFRVFFLLLSAHKLHFLISVALTLFNALILGVMLSIVLLTINNILFPGTTGDSSLSGYFGWVNGIFKELLPGEESKRLISLILFASIAVINQFFAFLIVYVNSSLTAKLTYDCRKWVFDATQKLGYIPLQAYARGSLIQLLVTETRKIYAVFKQVLKFIESIANAAVVMVMMILLSWQLFLVLLAGLLVMAAVNFIVVRSVKYYGKVALQYRLRLTDFIAEAIAGLKQTRLFQGEKVIAERLNQKSGANEEVARKLAVRNGALPVLTQLTGFGILVAIILVWYLFPVFKGGNSSGALLTFGFYLNRLNVPLGGLVKSCGTIFANLPGAFIINNYLQNDARFEGSGGRRPREFLQHSLEFKAVSFAYGQPDRPVLKNLNLKINRGEYIGIIGRSGEGKSTLLNLIVRLFDPDSGAILLDGVELRELDLAYLRSKISIISQDFFLFDTTLRKNLLMANPKATEGDLWRSVEMAGLQEFVKASPQGLDLEIGSNGEKLSGGQRQRICLAALFLRKGDLIILDEGMSAIDKETEEHILKTLRKLNRAGRTIISCTHKESSLADAQRIYRLSNGKLEKT